jgi:hypothetical protein
MAKQHSPTPMRTAKRSEEESGETIQRERTPGALRGRLGAVDRPNLTG